MPIPGRYSRALFWFRRDLHDYDNAGLCHALESSREVFCAFIFDREILDELPSNADRRVEFIWGSIGELRTALEKLGGSLIVLRARSSEAVPRLAAELKMNAVFANDDYEPLAIARDRLIHAPWAMTARAEGVGVCHRQELPRGGCRPRQRARKNAAVVQSSKRMKSSREARGDRHIIQPRADLPW
jgi:deoxyribodipyrimidine photolyase